MFARRAEDMPLRQDKAAEPVASVTEPAEPVEGLPRCMRPSSFASRRAEAAAREAERAHPRLVSLGKSDYWQRDRKGNDTYTEVELFMDVDHPTKRYVQLPGYTGFTPLFSTDGQTTEVEHVGTFHKDRRTGSRFLPASSDEVRPI